MAAYTPEEPPDWDWERSDGDSTGSQSLENSFRKMKAPNKKKMEEAVDSMMAEIKIKEHELKSLTGRPGEKPPDLNAIRTEKEAMIGRRKNCAITLKAINGDITKKMGPISQLKANLHYNSEDKINDSIGRLEYQLKMQNFKLSEEKKIVAEIDSLKRSKKVLSQYLVLKREVDDMRDRQRKTRDERDHCFKIETHLKNKEETARRTSFTNKAKTERLKKEIDELYEQKRLVIAEHRRYEKEYFSVKDAWKKVQRKESFKKREEDKQAIIAALRKEMEDYEAQKEPYEDEKQLCNTLIQYLQRFTPTSSTAPTTSTATNADMITISEESPVQSPQQPEKSFPAAEIADDNGGVYVLLKKQEEELFSGVPRKPKKTHKRKKSLGHKSLTHTPQIFAQFTSLNLHAPSLVAEIPVSIEQLNARKEYYESCPILTPPSLLRIPSDKSPVSDVQRQTSKPESIGSTTESVQFCDSVLDALTDGKLLSSSAPSPSIDDCCSIPECDKYDLTEEMLALDVCERLSEVSSSDTQTSLGSSIGHGSHASTTSTQLNESEAPCTSDDLTETSDTLPEFTKDVWYPIPLESEAPCMSDDLTETSDTLPDVWYPIPLNGSEPVIASPVIGLPNTGHELQRHISSQSGDSDTQVLDWPEREEGDIQAVDVHTADIPHDSGDAQVQNIPENSDKLCVAGNLQPDDSLKDDRLTQNITYPLESGDAQPVITSENAPVGGPPLSEPPPVIASENTPVTGPPLSDPDSLLDDCCQKGSALNNNNIGSL